MGDAPAIPDGHHPANDAQRTAALGHLRSAVAANQLELDAFSEAVTAVLGAGTLDQVAAVLARVAPPVRMTPAFRRLTEPLVLEIRSGTLALGPSWQLARHTIVSCKSGRVVLDLTTAEFDDLLVDLELESDSGSIDVVVPHLVDVQFVRVEGTSGRVVNRLTPNGSLPGTPCIRIKARTASGRIVIRRPEPPKVRRRWFGRRSGRVEASQPHG